MRCKNGILYFGETSILTLKKTGIHVLYSGSDISNSENIFDEISCNTCFVKSSTGEISLWECETPENDSINLIPASSAKKNVEITKICMKFVPTEPCELTDFSIQFDFLAENSDLWQAAKEGFHWIPGIKHAAGDVAGDHLLRSPVVVVSAGAAGAAFIPILDADNGIRSVNRYLDLRFDEGPGEGKTGKAPAISFGARPLELSGHVYYQPSGKPFPVGIQGIELSFYLLLFQNVSTNEIVQTISNFLWATYARKYEISLLPQTVPFATYAKYANGMALQYLWEKGPDSQSGGICLSTFRRNDGVMRGREYADDIWFHTWFNNMRTAMELAFFGKRMNEPSWVGKSKAVASCLLSAPQRDGIFPTIFAPHDGGWVCSSAHGGGEDLYSLPDCSWSAFWLRKYTVEHEPPLGAEGFLQRYRDFLYNHQNTSGGFPCWISAKNLESIPRLDDSASCAVSIWFLGEEVLCKAVRTEEIERATLAIKKGADYIVNDILPKQRFDDFELYYSCSPKPLDYYDAITCMYAQNTLAMQWCSEALRVAYLITGQSKYLDGGIFCLNILCLYQQVWKHPNLDFYSFGGFGVMNTDGEWNDARQSQFAETLSNYYELTGNFMYLRRAVAATRAGFALMVIDENKDVCPRNYQGSAINFEVHGSSAENYGHSCVNERSYQSGFHWGTGSALVAAARLKEKYSDLFIDIENAAAIGIDGISVLKASIEKRNIYLEIDILPGVDNFHIKTSDLSTGDATYNIVIDTFEVGYDSIAMAYTARKR